MDLMREVSALDEKALLSAVDVPVRVIYSAKDSSEEAQKFVETNSKYADFEAVFVHGVGHFLHLEEPIEVNRRLKDFLAGFE